MNPIPNFDKIKPAGARKSLPAGGFILRITAAADDPTKQYLKITYDVAEGPNAGHYSDEWGAANEWAHLLRRSYRLNPKDKRDEQINGMFKAFTDAVEASNPGYKWAWKEETLVGKIYGAVLGEEEYRTDRGNVITRLYTAQVMSADEIREGAYKVPALKPLKEDPAAGMNPAGDVSFRTPINDDDIPF